MIITEEMKQKDEVIDNISKLIRSLTYNANVGGYIESRFKELGIKFQPKEGNFEKVYTALHSATNGGFEPFTSSNKPKESLIRSIAVVDIVSILNTINLDTTNYHRPVIKLDEPIWPTDLDIPSLWDYRESVEVEIRAEYRSVKVPDVRDVIDSVPGLESVPGRFNHNDEWRMQSNIYIKGLTEKLTEMALRGATREAYATFIVALSFEVDAVAKRLESEVRQGYGANETLDRTYQDKDIANILKTNAIIEELFSGEVDLAGNKYKLSPKGLSKEMYSVMLGVVKEAKMTRGLEPKGLNDMYAFFKKLEEDTEGMMVRGIIDRDELYYLGHDLNRVMVAFTPGKKLELEEHFLMRVLIKASSPRHISHYSNLLGLFDIKIVREGNEKVNIRLV